MSPARRTVSLVVVVVAAACTFIASATPAGAGTSGARRTLASADAAVGAGKLDAHVLAALRANGSVEALVTFQPGSVQHSLRPHTGHTLRQVLREQRAAFDARKRHAVGSTHGAATVVRSFGNLPIALVRFTSESAILGVVNDSRVTGIRLDHSGTTSLAESLPLIHQPQAAAAGDTGAGTYVAVLDTGIDYGRSAFGCTSPGQPASCRVSLMYDENDNDGAADDGDFHGTNVAGIVAGVAPGARIIGLDVYGWVNGKQQWNDTSVTNAVNQLINLKANGWNVVAFNFSGGQSNFYSDGSCPNTGLAPVFAQAEQWGILPVVSAGNSASANGSFTRGIAYPGCVPGAVSVGATSDSAHGLVSGLCDAAASVDQIMYFSQAGSALSMLAPGNCITAAGITMQGTSQAAPHVAGAAADVAQAKFGSSLYYASGMQNVQTALTTSGPLIYDNRVGLSYHRLDVYAAVRAIAPTDTAPPAMGAVSEQVVGGTLGSTVPLKMTWSASDASGVAAYDVYVSPDGGATWPASAALLATTATSYVYQLTPGVTYQFAVRAKDGAGNWSTYRMSQLITPSVADDRSWGLGSPWSQYTWSSAYGGTSYTTSTTNAGLTHTFTGLDSMLLAPMFPTEGRITVSCDGSSYGTVDLYNSTTIARQIVAYCHFNQKAQHTMTINVEGTAGRPRVDVDGFVDLG